MFFLTYSPAPLPHFLDKKLKLLANKSSFVMSVPGAEKSSVCVGVRQRDEAFGEWC